MAEKLVKQEGGRGPSGCGHRAGCTLNFLKDDGVNPPILQSGDTLPKPKAALTGTRRS